VRAFRKVDGVLVAEVESFEVALLTSLVEQLVGLLGDPPDDARPVDSFAQWEGEMRSSVPLDLSDPVVQRLFPDAVPDDPVATAEFRRYTEDAQRRQRLADAAVVLDDLEASDGGAEPIGVPAGHFVAWIKTVNSLRLSLSARLGVQSEDDLYALSKLSARDPRSQIVDIFDWLGFVLESLIEANHP